MTERFCRFRVITITLTFFVLLLSVNVSLNAASSELLPSIDYSAPGEAVINSIMHPFSGTAYGTSNSTYNGYTDIVDAGYIRAVTEWRVAIGTNSEGYALEVYFASSDGTTSDIGYIPASSNGVGYDDIFVSVDYGTNKTENLYDVFTT